MENQEQQVQDTETETEDDTQGDETGMQQLSPADELRSLKQRATLLGMTYSPNIGLETLRERVNAKIQGTDETNQQAGAQVPTLPPEMAENPIIAELMAQVAALSQQVQSLGTNPFKEQASPSNNTTRIRGGGTAIPREVRDQIYKEQMKLVRIRITCLDPKKKDLPGEFVCVGNEAIGTVKKYIPYGDQTENGYHVPFCIYTFLKDKKFLNIRTRQDPKTRTPVVETGMVREYSVEVLDPLTPEELQRLAQQQAASDSIDRGATFG